MSTNNAIRKSSTGRTRRIGEVKTTSSVSVNTGKGSKAASNSGNRSDIAQKAAQAVLERFFAGGRKLMSVNGLFYHYRKGVWQSVDEQWLRGKVLRAFNGLTTKGGISSANVMTNALQVLRARQARRRIRLVCRVPRDTSSTARTAKSGLARMGASISGRMTPAVTLTIRLRQNTTQERPARYTTRRYWKYSPTTRTPKPCAGIGMS